MILYLGINMLNIELLRNNFDEVKAALQNRNQSLPQLDEFKELDKTYRELTTKVQQLNATRNRLSKQMSDLIAKKASKSETDEIVAQVTKIKKEITT